MTTNLQHVMPFAVGTIIAPNYESYARVLAQSLERQHPGSRLVVLVLAEEASEVRGGSSLDVILPSDLPIDRAVFHRMAAMYSVMELATALKPWLLRHLLARGVDGAIYLDPDFELFAPIDGIAKLAHEHSLVLTPHLTRPIPRDGLLPGEQEILVAGMYNLGFIGVGQRATPFLDWWQERLYADCRVDIARGLFVDQRWMDLGAQFFPHYILRDPGFDVAYWNLHERAVARENGTYYVGENPLRAFHYSGYEPDTPSVLSKHTRPRPRVRLSDDTALQHLFDGYRLRLLAEGWRQTRSRPYRYNSSVSGIPLVKFLRTRYRVAVLSGNQPPDPFEPASTSAFVAWIAEDFRRFLVGVYRRGHARLRSKAR